MLQYYSSAIPAVERRSDGGHDAFVTVLQKHSLQNHKSNPQSTVPREEGSIQIYDKPGGLTCKNATTSPLPLLSLPCGGGGDTATSDTWWLPAMCTPTYFLLAKVMVRRTPHLTLLGPLPVRSPLSPALIHPHPDPATQLDCRLIQQGIHLNRSMEQQAAHGSPRSQVLSSLLLPISFSLFCARCLQARWTRRRVASPRPTASSLPGVPPPEG